MTKRQAVTGFIIAVVVCSAAICIAVLSLSGQIAVPDKAHRDSPNSTDLANRNVDCVIIHSDETGYLIRFDVDGLWYPDIDIETPIPVEVGQELLVGWEDRTWFERESPIDNFGSANCFTVMSHHNQGYNVHFIADGILNLNGEEMLIVDDQTMYFNHGDVPWFFEVFIRPEYEVY